MQLRVGLLFRVLFSPLFIASGVGHLGWSERFVPRMKEGVLGAWLAERVDPTPLILASGVVLLVGGVLLAAGRWVRPAALALAAVMVPITLTTHVGKSDPGPLLKNVAILGTLVGLAQRKKARDAEAAMVARAAES